MKLLIGENTLDFLTLWLWRGNRTCGAESAFISWITVCHVVHNKSYIIIIVGEVLLSIRIIIILVKTLASPQIDGQQI